MFTRDENNRKENDELRMQIIRAIMSICDADKLKVIRTFIFSYGSEEFKNRPMRIDELALGMETEDIVKILDVLRNSDRTKHGFVRPYTQMYEAFKYALDDCLGADQEGE